MTSASVEQQFARVVDDLVVEFSAQVPERDVVAVVGRFRDELEPAATITDYLPVLVRRFAREQLLADLKRRPVAV